MASLAVDWNSTWLIKKTFLRLLSLEDTSNSVGELLRGAGLLPPPPEAPRQRGGKSSPPGGTKASLSLIPPFPLGCSAKYNQEVECLPPHHRPEGAAGRLLTPLVFPAPNQGPKVLLPSQTPRIPQPLMERTESGTHSLKRKGGTQGITAQRTGRPMSEEPGMCVCCTWKAFANVTIYGAFQPDRPSTF